MRYTVFMKLLDLKNPFNAPIYHEECVSSTMDAVRVLARKGEVHGTAIVADFQESGRGRQGRSWKTEKGQSLMFSIFLDYHDFSAMPKALTLKVGLAVSLAIEDFAPDLIGTVKVKWPNDVLLLAPGGVVENSKKAPEARKAAGILTEAEGSKAFVGIGVNIAQRYFPEELQDKAGSLLLSYQEKFPKEDAPGFLLSVDAPLGLLEKILFRLYDELEAPVCNASAAFSWKTRLEERLYMRGEQVSFAQGTVDSANIIRGRLAGIGESGELLLIPDGEEKPRAFITGELRVY